MIDTTLELLSKRVNLPVEKVIHKGENHIKYEYEGYICNADGLGKQGEGIFIYEFTRKRSLNIFHTSLVIEGEIIFDEKFKYIQNLDNYLREKGIMGSH